MFAHSGCKLCSFYSHRYLDWIGYTLTIPLDCVRNRYPYSLLILCLYCLCSSPNTRPGITRYIITIIYYNDFIPKLLMFLDIYVAWDH